MGITEDALKNAGYRIVDGRAVRTSRAGGPSQLGGGEAPASSVTRPPAESTSKYRNVKCEWQGELFDSKHEMEDWILLKAREAAREISDLLRQQEFPLYCPVYVNGENGRTQIGNTQVCSYIADFTYLEHGQRIVQDSKGHRTREYLLKRKWLERQEGIVIRET